MRPAEVVFGGSRAPVWVEDGTQVYRGSKTWIFDETERNKILREGIFPKTGSSGSDALRHTQENGALENFISTTTDLETAKYFGARNPKAQKAIEAKYDILAIFCMHLKVPK